MKKNNQANIANVMITDVGCIQISLWCKTVLGIGEDTI